MAERNIRGQLVWIIKTEGTVGQAEAESIADDILDLPRIKAGLALLDVRLAEMKIMREHDLETSLIEEKREAIRASLTSGLSLRKCAEMHGVGMGVVRGVKVRG